MKDIGVFSFVLLSLGSLSIITAAPPANDDIGYQVYLLKQRVDEHGKRLEVVERRTKTFTGLNITERRPATPGETRPPAASGRPGSHYTVQSGDSLWEISRRHKIDIDELRRSNGLTGTGIYAGQVLVIPASPESAAPSRRTPQAHPAHGTGTETSKHGFAASETLLTHVVAKGDTLFEIARRHGSSIDRIRKANDISDAHSIQVGQRLQIPVTTPEPSLAERPPRQSSRFAAATRTSRTATPDSLNIRRPSAVRPQGGHVASSTKSSGNKDLISYTLKSHDTLESVAQLFATSVPRLREINKLGANDQPSTGKMILVPTEGIFLDLHS